jgi:plasmid maintenance system killer protein
MEVKKKLKKQKAVVVEKLRKQMKLLQLQLPKQKLRLLSLKLHQRLLNNYEDNHSIKIKDKLLLVCPFFFDFL